MNKLILIERKKIPDLEIFNIDEYIDTEIEKYTNSFTSKARKEYELLDKISNCFVEFVENGEIFPYEYHHDICHRYKLDELTFLENHALTTFKSIVEHKGYSYEITKTDIEFDTVNHSPTCVRYTITVR